jgi:hypothetical protein
MGNDWHATCESNHSYDPLMEDGKELVMNRWMKRRIERSRARCEKYVATDKHGSFLRIAGLFFEVVEDYSLELRLFAEIQ